MLLYMRFFGMQFSLICLIHVKKICEPHCFILSVIFVKLRPTNKKLKNFAKYIMIHLKNHIPSNCNQVATSRTNKLPMNTVRPSYTPFSLIHSLFQVLRILKSYFKVFLLLLWLPKDHLFLFSRYKSSSRVASVTISTLTLRHCLVIIRSVSSVLRDYLPYLPSL